MVTLLRKSKSGITWVCRERIRRAKTQFEIQLARGIKGNYKGFYKYVKRKMKSNESIRPLQNVEGNLITG